MKRNQICDLLNISKSLLSLVLSGQRNSPLEPKIRFLLNFEDSFEELIRSEAFGELCEIVIKKSHTRKESNEVELSLNGRSLRNLLLNNINENDMCDSILSVFDKDSYIDRSMRYFIGSSNIESMCDIAMRSTKKLSIRRMALTLKVIHNEFWKPTNKKNEVPKM